MFLIMDNHSLIFIQLLKNYKDICIVKRASLMPQTGRARERTNTCNDGSAIGDFNSGANHNRRSPTDIAPL
jgi:hypothetical protein